MIQSVPKFISRTLYYFHNETNNVWFKVSLINPCPNDTPEFPPVRYLLEGFLNTLVYFGYYLTQRKKAKVYEISSQMINPIPVRGGGRIGPLGGFHVPNIC